MQDGNYSSEIARVGAFPGGGNMPDRIVELANLAMDPTYNVPDAMDSGVLGAGIAPVNPNAPVLDFRQQQFSYAAGGMVGPGGQPMRPAGVDTQGTAQGVTPEVMQREVQRIIQSNPEGVAQMRDAVMQALQTGELTPEELNMMGQLATAAAQNPELYPQIRQFAIQQGLASDADLPQEYDAGLVFTLLLIVQAAQAQIGGQPLAGGTPPAAGPGGMPQSATQPPVAGFKAGGALPADSHNRDGSIKINAHEGEYVIPAKVVRAKGTDFFDKMIQSYDETEG